jgi:stearoyl-CoA desaturase (delta-9 desaturase)
MKHKINWYTSLRHFLFSLPFFFFIGVIGTAYVVLTQGLQMATLALAIGYIFATGLSITAGYHRLFSHLAYKAVWPVRLFDVLFGAAAFEGSVLEWTTDHRDHHRYTDQDKDPYNIKKGLWYAHIGWTKFLKRTGCFQAYF